MLNQDFKEFIQSLNNNGVRYLVVGGYAVALHGYPRYTKDIDIWVEPSSENAAKIIQALNDFGFGSLDLNISDFTEPDMIIQLGYPPNRIDLVLSPAGVDFETCFTSRVIAEIEGVLVNFIDLENLRINKEAAGRKQDLADLENLE
jgi:predicted nucleotidyltransferase